MTGPPATRSRLDNRAPTRLMRRWRSAVASRQLIPIDRYDWLTTIVRGNAAAGVVCVRRSGPFRGPGRVQWLPADRAQHRPGTGHDPARIPAVEGTVLQPVAASTTGQPTREPGPAPQPEVDDVPRHPLLERQRPPVCGPGQHLSVVPGVVGDRTPRGHLHTRCDPVATLKTWIAGPPAEASRLATASLVPSGESAMSDVIKVDGVPLSTSTATADSTSPMARSGRTRSRACGRTTTPADLAAIQGARYRSALVPGSVMSRAGFRALSWNLGTGPAW